MKHFFLSLSFICFLLFADNILAQKLPFRFGKISRAEMEMTKCDFYPEAKAMVLGEYGVLNVLYDDHDGWKYELKTAVRKKIFDITEGDEGNIKIRLYQPIKEKYKEEINSFKAFTYNVVKGKLVTKKIGSKKMFKTRINDYWVEVSIAIPGIQNGSVIEYSYVKLSDYVKNLSTWYFQRDIPVAVSEFRYTLPEWFSFQIMQGGHLRPAERKTTSVVETYIIPWKTMPGVGGRTETFNHTLASNSTAIIDVMRNVPPLEIDPFVNNDSDIPARLNFQLISIGFPGRPIEYIAGTYAKFNEELMLNPGFGKRLSKGGFIDELVDQMEGKTKTAKAVRVYNHIANHFSWNNINGFISEKAGKAAYDAQIGTVADINLTLVAALQGSGIDAYPVILSTRGHGSIHEIYPNSEAFNYVIAAVVYDDEIYFADATTKLPFGQLPAKCRNGKAWLVKAPEGKWIDLKADSEYKKTTMLTAEITDSKVTIGVAQKNVDYAAQEAYEKIAATSEQEYTESLVKIFTEGEIEDLTLPRVDFRKPATIKYKVVKENQNADMLYFRPIQLGSIFENPFQREKRYSDIDFPYTQSYHVIFNLNVPENYTAELPEATVVELPDNQGKFVYNVSQTGNKVNIVSKVNINTTVFSVADYTALQEFYELVANKHQEPIVLKK